MVFRLLAMALLLGALDVRDALARADTIYRCAGADGEVMFTDLPCAGGQAQATQPLVTVEMSKLSPAERATLAELDHESFTRRVELRPRVTSSSAHVSARTGRRCVTAQDAVDRVRALKRHGYRASSAATIDARGHKAEAVRDRECAREPP